MRERESVYANLHISNQLYERNPPTTNTYIEVTITNLQNYHIHKNSLFSQYSIQFLFIEQIPFPDRENNRLFVETEDGKYKSDFEESR